jgi:stearoyl-CoA 9-desaturase NADPH oxidoreductase
LKIWSMYTQRHGSMAERGALPRVPAGRRRALRLVSSFTSPLLPSDYLELVNPLWSTRELRGRIERVERETPNAVTVLIKPGWDWPGHRAGQYLRLGIEVDGIHHWRAYSLTSDPARADGCIAITPKLVQDGKVSPFLFKRVRPGTIVRLGGVEGSFVLPDPLPEGLLFISAGSGITPIAGMLRSLVREGRLAHNRPPPRRGHPVDVVHLHCARTPEEVIFGRELRELHARGAGYRLQELHTGARARMTPAELDELCPDWPEREAFACGPAGLLSALEAHWEHAGGPSRLHIERFAPDPNLGAAEHGSGGTIRFCASGVDAASDGTQPILLAGEAAGAELPYGCRMGICHTCVGRLRAGQVRDLRTGRVHGAQGELLRTCVNAPEGPIEIEL